MSFDPVSIERERAMGAAFQAGKDNASLADRLSGAELERAELGAECERLNAALERVVEELQDEMKWNWTRMLSQRDAATAALYLLARVGLIEHRDHPLGGSVWKMGEKLYGRTDGITLGRFAKLGDRFT